MSARQVKVVEQRNQFNQMKDKMHEMEKSTINIGRNPGKAIQRISEPILDKIRNEVESEH